MTHEVEQCEIMSGYRSDHSAIILHLSLSENKRGPGLWKLNCSLLSEVNYTDSLRSVIKEAVAETSEFDARGRWDYIKFKIRYFSLRYSSDRKNKEIKRKVK